MLLAIDCGNTNTVFALFGADDTRRALWRMATEPGRTADDISAWLAHHMAGEGLEMDAISGLVIASVVPDCMRALRGFADSHPGMEAFIINAGDTAHGIEIKIDSPEQAGADRIANAAGAAAFGLPALVIDFGTATTFDLVDADGAYCGGAIAPGVNLSREALHRAAARLPLVDPAAWHAAMPVHGRNTLDAMHSGLFFGTIGMAEGMIERLEAAMGAGRLTVIATGGLAAIFASAIARIDHHAPDLTLNGMVRIYRHAQSGSGKAAKGRKP